MTQRNQLIDIIRGFSILFVMLLHCKIHLPIDQSFLTIKWVKILLISGQYGVMMFFVVSGFLITSNVYQRWGELANIKPAPFYAMRFGRIMPCLLGLICISSILHLTGVQNFILKNTSLERVIFSALTFHLNWLTTKVGYLTANWDVLWSLSVEEAFYVFFPLLCIVLRKEKYLIVLMLSLILIGPFARVHFPDDDIWSDRFYLTCMDGIAIGCLAAMIVKKITKKATHLFFLIGGLGLFCLIFFFRKFTFDVGITSLGLNVTLLEMGIAGILIASQQINFNGLRFIQWFGRNSYEIYLLHSIIILSMVNLFYRLNQPTWLIIAEYSFIIIFSGLLGQLIATYYTQPLNSFIRNRQFKTVYVEKNYEAH